MDGNILENFFLPEIDKKVNAIAVVGNEWWFSFNQKIVQTKYTTAGIEVQEKIEMGSRVNDLFVDELNNIWVATNNSGIEKISCLNEVFQKIDCKVNRPVFSIEILASHLI